QTLYMVTVSSDPSGLKIIRRYLTNSPQLDLRAVDRRLDAGKTYYWKVDALSPNGRLLMFGPTQSFIASAGPKAALRRANGELLQLASLAIPATLHTSIMDLTAQIKKRTPAPDSSVAELQPPVTVEFQSKVNPLDLSLMVDDIDVTPMAQATETKISYTPAMPLTSGNHSINVVVGTEAVSWKFAIAGAPAATQPAAPAPGATQPGTDAEGPPAVPAAGGQSVPPANRPPNAALPGQAPAGTTGLTQTSQVSMNTQWASGGNPPASNALSVAERMSYQDGPWHAEINGSGLLNSVLN